MAKATARHILVSSEDKCNELKAQIEGGADFADVAKAKTLRSRSATVGADDIVLQPSQLLQSQLWGDFTRHTRADTTLEQIQGVIGKIFCKPVATLVQQEVRTLNIM